MLQLYCDKCNKELNEKAALVFSPPSKDGTCDKRHICVECWKLLLEWMLAF